MSAPQLSRATLARVPPASRPLLEPGATAAGMVHLGLGAFHRAHQAVFTEDAVAAAGGDWGIVGVAPRSPGIVDALRAQDNLFSVASVSAGGRSTRVVGVLAGARLAAADPDAVVAPLAGAMPRWGALIIAAWIRFAQGTADNGRPLSLDDPLAAQLKARAAGRDPVDEVFGLAAVFPPELAGDEALKEKVRGWLVALTRHGVKHTLVAA